MPFDASFRVWGLAVLVYIELSLAIFLVYWLLRLAFWGIAQLSRIPSSTGRILRELSRSPAANFSHQSMEFALNCFAGILGATAQGLLSEDKAARKAAFEATLLRRKKGKRPIFWLLIVGSIALTYQQTSLRRQIQSTTWAFNRIEADVLFLRLTPEGSFLYNDPTNQHIVLCSPAQRKGFFQCTSAEGATYLRPESDVLARPVTQAEAQRRIEQIIASQNMAGQRGDLATFMAPFASTTLLVFDGKAQTLKSYRANCGKIFDRRGTVSVSLAEWIESRPRATIVNGSPLTSRLSVFVHASPRSNFLRRNYTATWRFIDNQWKIVSLNMETAG